MQGPGVELGHQNQGSARRKRFHTIPNPVDSRYLLSHNGVSELAA